MDISSKKDITTLEILQQEKVEAFRQLRSQKQILNDAAKTLFAPLPAAADKGSSIMRAFNTGMAVFDGVMIGVKLMRKVRKLFRG